MTESEPGWELFRTFLEVARDGSLSGAARKLALTQPTVGRHIDALEAALGLSLFSRSPQGLTADPGGARTRRPCRSHGGGIGGAAPDRVERRPHRSRHSPYRGQRDDRMRGAAADARKLSRKPSRDCPGAGAEQSQRGSVAARCGHRRPHGSPKAEVTARAPHRQDRDRFLRASRLSEGATAFPKPLQSFEQALS